MRNTEHLLFGLTSGLAFSSILHISGGFQIPQTAGFIGLALLGSILPDIDTPDSLISKRIFPNMSDFITRFFKHRTYFHDPAIYLMLMIPCFFIKVPGWIWGIFLGILGHLFLDAMTVSGIPIIYLFNKKARIHMLPKKLRIHSREQLKTGVVTGLFCMAFMGIYAWQHRVFVADVCSQINIFFHIK